MNELLTQPPAAEWMYMLFILSGIIASVVISELVRKHFHWPAEVTRKFVHVAVGILIFFAPMIFKSAVIPLILSGTAAIVMLFAVRLGLLVGIHGAARISYGTVFYPLSFFVLIILFWDKHSTVASLSMLGLATGDAAAAITGETYKSAFEYNLTSGKKSIEGSIAMFVVTALSLFFGMIVYGLQIRFTIEYLAAAAIVAAFISTAWEGISSKGLDNFTIPLSIALVLSYYLFIFHYPDPEQFTIGVILSLSIAILSYYLKFLNASGSVAVFLLASTIYGFGGWKWTTPIITFFILSSLFSKAGKKKKEQFEHLYDKSSTRDWGQVAANGGVAGLIIIAQIIFPYNNFYPTFLGATAAVTADTWGTEIGTWLKGRTIILSKLKFVEPGTNGGISLGGFLGGAAGAFIIAVSAYPWAHVEKLLLIITISGVTGSLFDSLLGGTAQAMFRCSKCNKQTERKIHCNSDTVFIKGFRWITNDTVNWSCALMGAIAAFILY